MDKEDEESETSPLANHGSHHEIDLTSVTPALQNMDLGHLQVSAMI